MTALDICNAALELLGEPRIPGIDPCGNLAARLCYMYYHPTRREVLCAHPWQHAERRTGITATQQNPFHRIAHRMPTDLLRLRTCTPPGAEVRNDSRTIWSRAETLQICYTADEEDLTSASENFRQALTLRLAACLCLPLGGSYMEQKQIAARYNNLLDSLQTSTHKETCPPSTK